LSTLTAEAAEALREFQLFYTIANLQLAISSDVARVAIFHATLEPFSRLFLELHIY
jgi:hypothetical protein